VLAHHYRSDWEWHDELLQEATKRLVSWRAGKDQALPAGDPGPGDAGHGTQSTRDAAGTQGAAGTRGAAGTQGIQGTRGAPSAPGAGGTSLVDEVRARLDDDLDTPGALAVIDAAVASSRPGLTQADVAGATALLGVAV
jgi:L-cysteine:1D-myo-inositol 2-amino-2-deoxy-alpha-D-glucopyranoside ligase